MEPAVGESVDGENVTIMPVEPAPEFPEGARLAEGEGGEVAQAQADRKRGVRANPFPDGQGVPLEGSEGFGPSFAPMDIRAVGQVKTVFEDHGVGGRIPRNKFAL
jgi:hypothetical protein